MDAQRLFQLHVAEYDRVSHNVRQYLRAERNVAALHNADQLRTDVLALLNNAETQLHVFPPGNIEQLRENVTAMLDRITARQQSLHDPSHGAPPEPIYLEPTGGRPRIAIDPDYLRTMYEMAGPAHIAKLLGIRPRTVRRRLLEAGIASAALPVLALDDAPDDGQPHYVRNPDAPGRLPSTISDADLDAAVASIINQFENHGRSMVIGQLRAANILDVSRERTAQSIRRVTGAPARFGRQEIRRREYRVAGPDSLWHHDGQHGLIHWKIVIHAFIDGYSRFVVGIRASNNNRAETVERLFREIITVHGAPSRVRGDHGIENLLVARLMEELRGLDRGSYIWGKSVHNVRIERLWVDVVKGFVAKWSNFFLALEHEHRLDRNDQFHIWLLHHLFLPCINFDAMAWADGWNNHTFSRLPNHPRRQHLPTPRELYFVGVHQHGVRAIEVVDADDLPQHDIAEYGIAWEEHEDERVMRIHWEHAANQVELDDADRHPNGYGLPRRLVEVRVPEPPVPIAPDEIQTLDEYLALHVDMDSTSMNVRRLWWVRALEFFNR